MRPELGWPDGYFRQLGQPRYPVVPTKRSVLCYSDQPYHLYCDEGDGADHRHYGPRIPMGRLSRGGCQRVWCSGPPGTTYGAWTIDNLAWTGYASGPYVNPPIIAKSLDGGTT